MSRRSDADGSRGGSRHHGGKPDDLTLKVLRLSRPFLANRVCPERILGVGGSMGSSMPFDDVLGVQRSFGTIYSGETFRCIFSLFNNADSELRRIVVKAELQTAGSRRERSIILDTSETPVGKLVAGEMKDFVASKRIKDTGLHNLVCSVRYVNTEGEESSFVKAFEFQGHDPLKIKRRIFQFKKDFFFEAQVTNVTQSTLYLEKVDLRPTEYYQCWNLGQGDGFDGVYISAGGSTQFLYRLRPTELCSSKDAPRDADQLFGSMEIVWNSTVGGRGKRLHHLRKKSNASGGAVSVELSGFPAHLVLERPVEVECCVRNQGDSVVEPVLQIAPGGAIAISSVSNRAMDALPPGGCVRFPLDLVPFATGIHSVCGVKIMDGVTGVVHEPDATYNILVKRDES